MKRLFLPVIALLLFYIPVTAQPRLGDYSQRGIASQEIKAEGFVASHPSLPLNSQARIINPRNDKEVEVTITGRIAPSPNRIIDLSFSAMEVLGIKEGGTVILTVGAPQPSERTTGYGDTIVNLDEPFVPFKKPKPAETISEKKEDESEENLKKSGIVINNYVYDEKKGRADTEFLAWLMASSVQSRQAREARESAEIREARESREKREILYYQDGRSEYTGIPSTPAPLEAVPRENSLEVQIIPGLPDRNSGKIYRLQVGAYSAVEAANKAAESVKSAGFNAETEYTGAVYRVLAAGIPSSDIYSASIKLGTFGFGQIWVRE